MTEKVIAKPRMHDVARPPRPCRKGEGALATPGFAIASEKIILIRDAVGKKYGILSRATGDCGSEEDEP